MQGWSNSIMRSLPQSFTGLHYVTATIPLLQLRVRCLAYQVIRWLEQL